jgi:hypothetical protein
LISNLASLANPKRLRFIVCIPNTVLFNAYFLAPYRRLSLRLCFPRSACGMRLGQRAGAQVVGACDLRIERAHAF